MSAQKHNFIEDNFIILSKQTIEAFLQEKNPSDLIALYSFYYYTAKWQQTNQPKATTNFTAQGLKWSEARVRKNKQILLKLSLIENKKSFNEKTKQITGHYIKLNYLWKNKTVKKILHKIEQKDKTHPNDFAEGGFMHPVEIPETNALSINNINALSESSLNALPPASAGGELPSLKSKIKEEGGSAYKEFNWRQEIQKLRECPQRHISLIGMLFIFHRKFYGFKFDSKKELEKAIKRNVRDAVTLASMGYEDDFYAELFKFTALGLKELNHGSTPIFHLATTLRFKDNFKLEHPNFKKLNLPTNEQSTAPKQPDSAN